MDLKQFDTDDSDYEEMKEDIEYLKTVKSKKKERVQEIEADIEEEEKAQLHPESNSNHVADVEPAGFSDDDKCSAFDLIEVCEERGTTVISLAEAMDVTDVPMLRSLLLSMDSDGSIIYQKGSGSPDSEKVWSKAAVEHSNDGDSVDGALTLRPTNSAVEASLHNDIVDPAVDAPVPAQRAHDTRSSRSNRL